MYRAIQAMMVDFIQESWQEVCLFVCCCEVSRNDVGNFPLSYKENSTIIIKGLAEQRPA